MVLASAYQLQSLYNLLYCVVEVAVAVWGQTGYWETKLKRCSHSLVASYDLGPMTSVENKGCHWSNIFSCCTDVPQQRESIHKHPWKGFYFGLSHKCLQRLAPARSIALITPRLLSSPRFVHRGSSPPSTSVTSAIDSGRTPSPPLSTGGDCPPAKMLTYGGKITHFGVLLFQQHYGPADTRPRSFHNGLSSCHSAVNGPEWWRGV